MTSKEAEIVFNSPGQEHLRQLAAEQAGPVFVLSRSGNKVRDFMAEQIEKRVNDILTRRTDIMNRFREAFLAEVGSDALIAGCEMVERTEPNGDVVWFFRKREFEMPQVPLPRLEPLPHADFDKFPSKRDAK